MIGDHRSSALIEHFLNTGEAFVDNVDSGKTLPKLESDLENIQLPAGLQNIGNTCYLNSLLQLYFTIKPLRNSLFASNEPANHPLSNQTANQTANNTLSNGIICLFILKIHSNIF